MCVFLSFICLLICCLCTKMKKQQASQKVTIFPPAPEVLRQRLCLNFDLCWINKLSPYYQKLDDPSAGPALQFLPLLSGFTLRQLLSLKAAGCPSQLWCAQMSVCICVCMNSIKMCFTAWDGTGLVLLVDCILLSLLLITYRPTVQHQGNTKTHCFHHRKHLSLIYFSHQFKIFFLLASYTVQQDILLEYLYMIAV